jgi:hypothetical protein
VPAPTRPIDREHLGRVLDDLRSAAQSAHQQVVKAGRLLAREQDERFGGQPA